MISAIRKYILSDAELLSLLNNKQSIYQVEKPSDINANPYIIVKYKPLSGGYIKDYQVEFDIICDDLSILNSIQQRLIALLDDSRNEKIIKDDKTTIRSIKLLNGGGTVKNPETGNFLGVLFFIAKI